MLQDTDGDGLIYPVDDIPLVRSGKKSLLIHQTWYREGIKKEANISENKVEPDLKFNDYSY